MKENVLNEQYHFILSLLYKKQLKDAISELKEYMEGISDWNLTSELEEIETSYNFMLQYMRQNARDPERKKLHTRLLAETFGIADQARIQKAAANSNRYYYNIRNYLKTLPNANMKTLLMELEAYTEEIAVMNLLPDGDEKNPDAIRLKHEENQHNLFNLVWTNSAWSAEDEANAGEILRSVLLPANDLSLFVSAVTLSIMECFDLRKIMWLFDAYEHEDVHVNQRALVGLAIVFHIFHRRIELFSEINARLLILNEDESFGKQLSRVHIQLLRSQETEKIDKKMREEIIPEMLRSSNLRNMKFDFDESDEDMNDQNPDWEQQFENSPLADKLKEMSELQMEGADVYMSTFSALKSYPFFKTLSNWFYPFDPQHSSVVKEMDDKQNSVLNLILESGLFCDSDKYSLCFTIMHIPQAQRDVMISQLSEQQLNELKDEQKSNSLKKYSTEASTIANQYIHNLYRFFKLYPRRHEFRDIFKEALRLNEYPVLKPILNKEDLLLNLAQYYFRKDRNADAIRAYEALLDMVGGTAEIYQKIGYCFQKERDYENAIDAYLKADVIKPDNVWTNRHLATSYRLHRNFEKALEYYHKVEEVQPENKTLLFNIGSCLAELEQFDEALKYFFKLDFIDPDNIKVWRAIGWCSFASGKLEQSDRYYEKIIGTNPLAPDYMNAGHVAWSEGNMEKAIDYYSKAVDKYESKAQFTEMFYKDVPCLLQYGINEDDIPLLLDLL